MIGIPLTMGFMSKYLLAMAALETQKKLMLTPEARKLLDRAEQDIYETEALLTRGMKPEEIAQLHELLNRMLQNIGE